LVNKGKDAVGVARQSWGSLGQVDHAQGGVFAADASRHGDALVEKRLVMPESWLAEAYTDRRHTCNVPDEVPLHTKPQLAVAMVRSIRHEGRRPGTSRVADGL